MNHKDITGLIGNTPLVPLDRYCEKFAVPARIYAKLENMNPTGSVKDRTALYMITSAERDGLLKEGGTVIEPTSGNTGIALSAICAQRGYKAVIVMPDNMSAERIRLISAYGAEVVLTDSREGMRGAIRKAREIQSVTGGFIPQQFSNPANVAAHAETGEEIYKSLPCVDIFIAGVGTGGTLTGAGAYLKNKNRRIKVIAVEPEGSPRLSAGRSGRHAIQGIGAGFVPEVLDVSVYDEVMTVSDSQAFEECGRVAGTEGIFVGISSGAALSCAVTVAHRPENRNKNIVVIFPDSGDRYLSIL